MTSERARSIDLAQGLAADLAEFSRPKTKDPAPPAALSPEDSLLNDFDRRIIDSDLRTATRSRFISEHYADAVEAGVKVLNECVRAKSGSTEDGDALMTSVFSEKSPKLRINRLRSASDRSEQRGHMMMCQGVVAAWRNPRAHSTEFDDTAEKALMMLEHVQHLIEVTKAATRTRTRRA